MKPGRRLKEQFREQRNLKRAGKLLRQRPELFEEVQTYSFFVGYPRSGHSLTGSLLDAHPHAVIAHELDALKYVNAGHDRRTLFALIIDNARRIGRKGRKQTGYSYQVPGQYQGDWQRVQVIGDKRGGNSSRWLREKPELLEQLRERLSEELRCIHISRNPFDNITTMAHRHAKGRPERMTEAVLRQEKEHYLELAKAVEQTRQALSEEEFLHIPIASLLEDPGTRLSELLNFLGLELREDHLEACKSILYRSPSRSRERFHWPEELVKEVESKIKMFPCLEGYGFETE